MHSFARPAAAAVIGASEGIGGALVEVLSRSGSFEKVFTFARHPGKATIDHVVPGHLDLADEASIMRAAMATQGALPLRLVMVATGMLHEEGLQPEKSFKMLEADHFARAFAINATGPAMVAKHFLPRLPRQGRSAFAALSARVGSISDNQLGGWYAYRASKAALNMLIRSLSIELARTHPDAVCVGLHPGTVDSRLSQPFQAGVPAGKLFKPADAAALLLAVVDGLAPARSGGCFAWDGSQIPP
ncbi:MAG TPA: SDR family NAD(P)-dependent oxidoreductase [Geminicoccus sp.]|jgi:NAD(P)-dependent dehydrogenase (short-subunit alcohol dehydrogenase family)|uniref:SDR family NAD(P)-dependent oxidoreductase n=1 Tax=Geminicoccus sp. TaxID=2024832 RepID=UPI002E30ED9A|nr:SDR family NAD(P)-dependent oxidoreductase [Geminicoccus sp.]HEX2526863.1 SDR family NAD(P)-dependent oxidoreductase [Geminicoccus sp.]